ncbi:MAG: TetR/AcrR family transcriptional regulator [Raoultibacter sp.]
MKQDHRVRITKMMLRENFLELLKQKPLAKITVKELCEKTGVNRATFYAHYKDMYGIYEEIEAELTQTIMNSLNATLHRNSISEFSNELCTIIVENRSSCEAIFGEFGEPELANRVVDTLNESSIAVWRNERPELSDSDLKKLYTFMANGSLAIIRSWVQNGMQESPEEIARFIEKMSDFGLAAL